MNAKMIYAWIAAIIGEVLVIALNILFSGALPTNIIVLNCIVCTLIYASSCLIFFVKWDRSEDKAGTWAGTLGVNLWSFSLYSILAFAAILAMNLHLITEAVSDGHPVCFKYQILVHGILVFFLIIARFFSHAVAAQVANVHQREESLTGGLDEMKSATGKLQDAIFNCSVTSAEVRTAADEIQQNLRFLSPVRSSEAKEIEKEYTDKVYALIPCFVDFKINEESIVKQLAILKRIVDKRKNIRN